MAHHNTIFPQLLQLVDKPRFEPYRATKLQDRKPAPQDQPAESGKRYCCLTNVSDLAAKKQAITGSGTFTCVFDFHLIAGNSWGRISHRSGGGT